MSRSSEDREILVQNLKKYFPMADPKNVLEENKLEIKGGKRTLKALKEGKLAWLKDSGIDQLVFTKCSLLKTKYLTFLKDMESLKDVMFDKCRLHPDVLAFFASIDHVTSMTLQNTHLPEWTFEIFRGNTHLKSLNINGCVKHPKEIQDVLLGMTCLEELSFMPVGENMNAFLKKVSVSLPNLKSLGFGPNIRLGVSGCQALAEMKSLEKLILFKLLETPDMSLPFLEEMPQLKELFLGGCPFVECFDVKLPALEELTLVGNPNLSRLDLALYPNLKELTVESFPKFPSEENQQIELKDLDSASSLKELKLSRLDLVKEDFRALEMLMNLESIELDMVPVGDENLHFLGGSPALKTLILNNDESPSADSLCELGLMPSLETLVIQNGEFLAGSGMAFVRNMPKLRMLALLGCKLTDEDMHGLTSAKELESLGLNNCSQVTDAGLACLNEMKELRLVRLANCAAENCEIRELPHLRNLVFEEFNDLVNLQISDLPELKLLAIHGAGLKTLTLTNLPELNSLAIERCQALSFMKLGGIPSLDHFDAIGSEQLDLTGLHVMKKVRSVSLAYTQLRQEGVLDSLREMPGLEWLTIANRRDLEVLSRIGKQLQNADDEDPFEFVSEEKMINEMIERSRPAFRIDEEEAIREALPNCDVSFSINLK